jgi:hypothetical protein
MMRKCALLVLFTFLPICAFSQQTPFSTIGNLVVNGLFQNTVAVPHSYKIATLPANTGAGHDFLRILVTLNPNYQGNKDSYIDATFANRGGFTYQYMLLGAPVTTITTLAAYQNADSSVDIYIVFSGASQYTIAGYTMLQNLQETIYPTPPDANASGGTISGTLVFDASSSLYPPTIAFDQSSQILSAADSAAVPTYTWSGDTNTGLFSPAADSIGISTGGVERMRVDSSGHVGIGTTTPNYLLDVEGVSSAPYTPTGTSGVGPFGSSPQSTVFISNQSQTDGGAAYLAFGSKFASGTTSVAYIGNVSTPSNTSGTLVFGHRISSGPGWAESMRIDVNGNVGVGTANPQAKIDVNGNVKISGSGASLTFPDGSVQSTAYTGISCGGDYAESVDVTGDRSRYEPGDVLVIDSKDPGKFLKSAEPYSTSVTGIYSTKPGYVGRRQTTPKNPEEVPMAMVGIVPTKVTAENGPIHPGDLLVSSSSMGYAMKGTDRGRMLGAVIGKALGHLDSGSGVIEVVITLQ